MKTIPIKIETLIKLISVKRDGQSKYCYLMPTYILMLPVKLHKHWNNNV